MSYITAEAAIIAQGLSDWPECEIQRELNFWRNEIFSYITSGLSRDHQHLTGLIVEAGDVSVTRLLDRYNTLYGRDNEHTLNLGQEKSKQRQDNLLYAADSMRIRHLGRSLAPFPWLQKLANNDYYSNCKVRDKDGGNGFTTPLESMPGYVEQYGNWTIAAYKQLETTGKITPGNPFTVVIVGDGNGSLTRNIGQHLVDSGVAAENLALMLIDQSANLLDIQSRHDLSAYGAKVEICMMDITQNGLDQKLSGRVGVVLTEELMDDLDVLAFTIENEYEFSGRWGEVFSGFDGDLTHLAVFPPLDNKLMTEWLKLVPGFAAHIRRFQRQMNYNEDFQPILNLQFGVLKFMHNLSQSGFVGYWLGGDYHSSYAGIADANVNALTNPVQFIPTTQDRTTSGLSNLPYMPVNITGDVDPETWIVLPKLGMRTDFIGTTVQWLEGNNHCRQKLIPRLLTSVDRINANNSISDRKKVLQLANLYEGLKRFSWVVATDPNLPTLNKASYLEL